MMSVYKFMLQDTRRLMLVVRLIKNQYFPDIIKYTKINNRAFNSNTTRNVSST